MINNPSNIIKTRLPEDWSVHRFNEISDFDKKTVDPLKNPDKFWNYITISDIKDYRINSFQQILGKEAPSRARKRVVNGDILVSTVRPYLKANAKIDERYDDFICSTGFSVLSPKESVLSDYLFYLIQTDQFTNELMRRMVGATYPAVTSSDIKHLKIPVPPLVEQRGIVEVLGTVDECIRLTDGVIERAEELKRGLMQQLLTRGMGHTEYNMTKWGEMPKEWKLLTFKDICSVNQGLQIAIRNRKKEPGINRFKYITIQFIMGNKEIEYIENPNLSVVCNQNDILMTRTGNTGMVFTNQEGVFHNNFFKINYNREIVKKEYLIFYLNTYDIQKLIKIKAGVTTIPDLNHGDFYSIPFKCPSLTEQDKILDILQSVEKKIDLNKTRKEKFDLLKKGLIQSLLSGKIRVELKGDGLHRIGDGREANN